MAQNERFETGAERPPVPVTDLRKYLLISLGMRIDPVTPRELLQPLSPEATRTFREHAFANPSYEARGSEQTAEFLGKHLVDFGSAEYVDGGRRVQITEQGGEVLESILESVEAGHLALPYLEELLRSLQASQS